MHTSVAALGEAIHSPHSKGPTLPYLKDRMIQTIQSDEKAVLSSNVEKTRQALCVARFFSY